MKYIKTGIISALLCLLCAFTAFSAQGSISFTDPEVNAGDEVNVTMKVYADEGTKLNSANIVLTYPSDGLEFVSGTDAEGGAGSVRVHGTSNGNGTAELDYNLKFKTSTAGSYSIAVDSYEVYDADDQPIEFTHVGGSTVNVKAEDTASADCTLSSLEVYPGTLDPAFSSDVTEYSVTVGLNVNKLVINAISTDGTANVSVSNNGEIPEDNPAVTVTVKAADGTSSLDYIINVNKVEGGPEATESVNGVDVSEGVQLSSKGKTITIINPGDDVVIPDGFKEGTISIDDQKVQGWVWGASENPEYCVVYGMNDKGELNFYRYDMAEKTIQRYFEDPLAANSVSNADYTALSDEKDAAERSAETRLILVVIIAVIAFAAIMCCVYLWFRLRTADRMQKIYRKQRFNRTSEEEEKKSDAPAQEAVQEAGDLDRVDELLKHDYSNESAPAAAESAADETQVIRRPERRRRVRRNRVAEAENIQNEIADLSLSDDVQSDVQTEAPQNTEEPVKNTDTVSEDKSE